MQVQRIQNSNYNPRFGAKVELKGFIDDIGKETKQIWEEKAKSIGTDKDLITLTFGMPFYKSGRRIAVPVKNRSITAVAEINGEKSQAKDFVRAQNTRQLYKATQKSVSELLDKLS